MIHHAFRLKPRAPSAPASFHSVLLDAAARAYVRVRTYTDDSASPKGGQGTTLPTFAREAERPSVRREREGHAPQLWLRRDNFVQGSSTVSHTAFKTAATSSEPMANATMSEGSVRLVTQTPRHKTYAREAVDPRETPLGTPVARGHVRRQPFTRREMYVDDPASWSDRWPTCDPGPDPLDFPLRSAPFVSLQPPTVDRVLPEPIARSRFGKPPFVRVPRRFKTQDSRRMRPDPSKEGVGMYPSSHTFTLHDMSVEDPAQSPAQTWTDASGPAPSDFPLCDAPLVSVEPLVAIQVPMPGGTAPTASRTQLKERMVHVHANPPRDGRRSSVSEMVTLHRTTGRHLHSTRSFNLLVAAHMRFGRYGRASGLLKEMRMRGIPANVETWKLRTRLLVRRGMWPEAWVSVTNAREDYMGKALGASGVPVAVWAELLGTAALGAMRRLKGKPGERERVMGNVDRGMTSGTRYGLVMGAREELVKDGGAIPPNRVVVITVQALLRMGEREGARSLTEAFLGTESEGLGRRLVNAYVGPWEKRRGLGSYYKTTRDLRRFLRRCPSLRLDGTTLFRLLGHLTRARGSGTSRAVRLVRWFRGRWGERVVTERVQRRLVLLAGKEGRRDVVKAVMARWRRRRHVRYLWRMEREVRGRRYVRGRGRVERSRDGKVYGGRGRSERDLRRALTAVRARLGSI
ncbi:hypothetical protein OF83DRAFT_527594 [Amylostereum chailletii]|nr:hypothetical protein OF83DRAFT_527594 [Amylostereum chailletii]